MFGAILLPYKKYKIKKWGKMVGGMEVSKPSRIKQTIYVIYIWLKFFFSYCNSPNGARPEKTLHHSAKSNLTCIELGQNVPLKFRKY